MNFKGNLVLWCILLLTKHCVLAKVGECVQRRLGACKVLTTLTQGIQGIKLKDFHSPQPEGYALKTSIEINLLKNKHSFENNLPVERKRAIGYNLDNAALVRIRIVMDDWSYIQISLGKKYYRLAELEYHIYGDEHIDRMYNLYTPSLPTFPYNLHFEMTTNGTFSVYADANKETFFQYQLDKRPNVKVIEISAPPDQTDLIAFLDCSDKHKPNCGTHHVDTVYGCREWFVKESGYFRDFDGFQKTYETDVLFDEFVVVDIAQYSSIIVFSLSDAVVRIVFKDSSIKAGLGYDDVVKSVQTTKWSIIPGGPYAVHVLLEKGPDNHLLTISNIRGEEILTLNLCGVNGGLKMIQLFGPKLYFDCLHPDDDDDDDDYNDDSSMMSERPRKTNEKDHSEVFTYHENGYNFSKTFLDTHEFLSGPFVIYKHKFGNSTEDWCEGHPQPKLFVTSEDNDDSLQSVIKSSNKALLSELEKISNVTVDAIKPLLSELQQISAQMNATADTNTVVLSELRSVKMSIDALDTHLERNTTTVNNYYNQLNVTEFLKLIKRK